MLVEDGAACPLRNLVRGRLNTQVIGSGAANAWRKAYKRTATRAATSSVLSFHFTSRTKSSSKRSRSCSRLLAPYEVNPSGDCVNCTICYRHQQLDIHTDAYYQRAEVEERLLWNGLLSPYSIVEKRIAINEELQTLLEGKILIKMAAMRYGDSSQITMQCGQDRPEKCFYGIRKLNVEYTTFCRSWSVSEEMQLEALHGTRTGGF